MKWILMLAWATNGTGYTLQEFNTYKACVSALYWAERENRRNGTFQGACINSDTGEIKRHPKSVG